jgi:hypothetical protein
MRNVNGFSGINFEISVKLQKVSLPYVYTKSNFFVKIALIRYDTHNHNVKEDVFHDCYDLYRKFLPSKRFSGYCGSSANSDC